VRRTPWFPIGLEPGDGEGCMATNVLADGAINPRSINWSGSSGLQGSASMSSPKRSECIRWRWSGRSGLPRLISTILRLATQVVKSLPHRHLSLSPSRSGPFCRLGHPWWPHRATGPRSSPRTVGSCGYHLVPGSVGWVSSWPSCPSAELLVQQPSVSRGRGHRPS
jgi:hypothetical protein